MLEVADILREHFSSFLEQYDIPYEYYKVVNALINCRTATLGAHLDTCDVCGHETISYNSCRNRHCPKCQQANSTKWLLNQQKSLIDVKYFHVVFTVPDILNEFIFFNQSFAYNLLFKAVSETLLDLSSSKKFLDAKIGFTSILHTWGQNLSYHPHIHCIVTGGGLDSTHSNFIHSKDNYLLPVKVLSSVFRGKFKFYLEKAIKDTTINFSLPDHVISDEIYFKNLIKSFYKHDWVVFSKPTFDHPQAVLKYLSNYTHRIAISNYRIISLKDGIVSFSYKDYKDNNKQKILNLTAIEFIRRFLMHILPNKFVKIRHYGLLCNRYRKENIKLCHKLIGVSNFLYGVILQGNSPNLYICPSCKKGHMHFSKILDYTIMKC